MSVVLPEPEGPMMAIHSPASTRKETPSSARTFPNSLRRFSIWTSVATFLYSPRKISAGFTLPSMRNGSAPASVTAIISAIVSGKTSQRGEIDVPNTRCPIQYDKRRA